MQPAYGATPPPPGGFRGGPPMQQQQQFGGPPQGPVYGNQAPPPGAFRGGPGPGQQQFGGPPPGVSMGSYGQPGSGVGGGGSFRGPPGGGLPAPPGGPFRGQMGGTMGPGGMGMPQQQQQQQQQQMRGPPPGMMGGGGPPNNGGGGGPLAGLPGPGGAPPGAAAVPQMTPQQQQMMQMMMQQQGMQMTPQQQQMMMMMVMQMTAGAGGPAGPGGPGGPGAGPGGPGGAMGGPGGGGPGGPPFMGGGPPRPNSLFITPQMLMAKSPTKWGWMIKQGGGIKSWKRRFFILVNDKLYYFEKENAKEPKGFIQLDRSTAVNNTFVQGKQNCFAIKTGARVFLVSAESVAEADDWIRVLSETAHGRATTFAAPMKPIAKKKKDLTLARHVLLTKNCCEALKKQRREEVDELVQVAQSYLDASAQLAVLGKQLCDALIKVSASTQSHDVGEALKEVAQYQKQLFLQRANENDMLRKGVIQATVDAAKQDLVDVLGFEKRQKNALKAVDLKLKKEEAIARKLRGRGDVGEQAKGRLMAMVRERDDMRESQLREVLTLERFKYIKILTFWRGFSELTAEHQREAVRTIEDKLPSWRRFDTADVRRKLPPNVEDLIAGRIEDGPAFGAAGVTASASKDGAGNGDDDDFQKPPPQYGVNDDGDDDDDDDDDPQRQYGNDDDDDPQRQYGNDDDDDRQYPNEDGDYGDENDDDAGGDYADDGGAGGDLGFDVDSPVLFVARAQWASQADTDVELSFEAGDELEIVDDSDEDWWVAKAADGSRVGKVPAAYFEK